MSIFEWPLKTGFTVLNYVFVGFDALCPSQQYFSHVWMISWVEPVLSIGYSVLLKDATQ